MKKVLLHEQVLDRSLTVFDGEIVMDGHESAPQ
jgi:hypothetical protein